MKQSINGGFQISIHVWLPKGRSEDPPWVYTSPQASLWKQTGKNSPNKLQFQIILLCQIFSYLRFGAIGSITYLYTCFVIIPNIPNKDTATKSNHHGLAMPVGPALEATRPSSRGLFLQILMVHLQHLGYSSVSSSFRFWKFCSFVWNYIPDQQKACMYGHQRCFPCSNLNTLLSAKWYILLLEFS